MSLYSSNNMLGSQTLQPPATSLHPISIASVPWNVHIHRQQLEALHNQRRQTPFIFASSPVWPGPPGTPPFQDMYQTKTSVSKRQRSNSLCSVRTRSNSFGTMLDTHSNASPGTMERAGTPTMLNWEDMWHDMMHNDHADLLMASSPMHRSMSPLTPPITPMMRAMVDPQQQQQQQQQISHQPSSLSKQTASERRDADSDDGNGEGDSGELPKKKHKGSKTNSASATNASTSSPNSPTPTPPNGKHNDAKDKKTTKKHNKAPAENNKTSPPNSESGVESSVAMSMTPGQHLYQDPNSFLLQVRQHAAQAQQNQQAQAQAQVQAMSALFAQSQGQPQVQDPTAALLTGMTTAGQSPPPPGSPLMNASQQYAFQYMQAQSPIPQQQQVLRAGMFPTSLTTAQFAQQAQPIDRYCSVCLMRRARRSHHGVCSLCYGGVYKDIRKWLKLSPRFEDKEEKAINAFVQALRTMPRGCKRNFHCLSDGIASRDGQACTRCRTLRVCFLFPSLVFQMIKSAVHGKGHSS